MQNVIALEVFTSTSENGFSLDELVITTGVLLVEKDIPGFMEQRRCGWHFIRDLNYTLWTEK